MSSRRGFLGAATAGAAALALRPVFARNPLIAAPANGDRTEALLNFNENPYGPSPQAMEAIVGSVARYGRYYHDWDYYELRSLLAKRYGLTPEHVLVGAGSTEILKLCDDVFLRTRPRLVVAEPAYEAVILYAVNSRAEAVKVPLTRDFRHDLPAMAKAVAPNTGMVYLCNPNNPTGTIVGKEELGKFLDAIPRSVPVVIDEAYAEYVSSPDFESGLRYVRERTNVVVVRTFSKIHGLAGMRIGYAFAPPALAERLRPHAVGFAISSPAVHAAVAALGDQEHVKRCARQNREQLESLYQEARALGLSCIPSQANFAMIHLRRPVAPVIAEFARRGIHVGREFRPLTEYLRVTIGTQAEMQRFHAVLREIVRS
jgi:histidinol-phosphate aminotransferase